MTPLRTADCEKYYAEDLYNIIPLIVNPMYNNFVKIVSVICVGTTTGNAYDCGVHMMHNILILSQVFHWIHVLDYKNSFYLVFQYSSSGGI